MAHEIERKFLVSGDGWKPLVTARHRLAQGYLATGDRSAVRVRIQDDAKAFLTIKSAVSGTTRQEFEYEIPVADARDLLKLAVGAVVAKTRHEVPLGGHLWEIDVFEGDNAGLTVAEVELDLEDENVALPDWISTEITGDKRYYNASLTHRPYKDWKGA